MNCCSELYFLRIGGILTNLSYNMNLYVQVTVQEQDALLIYALHSLDTTITYSRFRGLE